MSEKWIRIKDNLINIDNIKRFEIFERNYQGVIKNFLFAEGIKLNTGTREENEQLLNEIHNYLCDTDNVLNLERENVFEEMAVNLKLHNEIEELKEENQNLKKRLEKSI